MATDKYDFIIVGGGTAGLVMANRLTEDSNVHVLVLEAGKDQTSDPQVTTPLLYPTLMGSDADWDAVTEPQAALRGKTIRIPYGRILGGSSAINGQLFLATSKVNIDAWGELSLGWNWDILAPYFRKSFTLSCPPPGDPVYDHFYLDYIESSVNGTDGPIKASFPSDIDNPIPKAWIETMRSLGHGSSADPFSGNFTGAFTNAASIDPLTRQRSGAASAYWEPAKYRKNLTVITAAHVQRVILTGDSPNVIATGVEYVHNGENKTANAEREVILSAGVMHSPKILELSGIGNPDILSSFGIHVAVANKSVGENLQDHPMTGLSFQVKDDIKTVDDLLRQDPVAMEVAMKQYEDSKSGPLAVGGVLSYALLGLQDAFAKQIQDSGRYYSSLFQNPKEATVTFCAQASQGNFGAEAGSSLLNANFLPGGYCTIAAFLLQPLSRGYVHIRSSNPSDPVKVDPRYLTHPLDIEMFARHMTYISTIVSTEPFASLLKPSGRRNASAPADIGDVEAMKEYITKTTLSSWHPTSTCAMLPLDKGGVVNERLIVHGTQNLRVVDASVFPLTTRSNPMATVYAVAERAADLVKEDLKARK
ncbi:glucose-methanol-choline oxidoreductase-like protein [Hypoxylon trugodes]|uniref:glucose-methanol-choline oxidoreductase-like protein n=1 Tax=Hypoxylon trugodes TaxID=326681 RepID=UPI0021944744|nr:glucose-methanol-choline oxidoreductase-like protein [Hypoxylon trugodes]KAI1387697.1 glucose-methanol-choline oxidoreductase-like protein [Hypoxylon trugodes]